MAIPFDERCKWIPDLDDEIQEIDTDSWFRMTKCERHPNRDYSSIEVENEEGLIRTEKIKIFPDEQQREILQKWFELTRKMYNITTRFIRDNIYINNQLYYPRVRNFVNFRNLRNEYLKDEKNRLIRDNIRVHILDQTIARCVADYKGNITKMEEGLIDHFRVRSKKKDKRYRTMLIEGSMFSKPSRSSRRARRQKNGFCVKALGEMKSEVPLTDINTTSILGYDRNTSEYCLFVPRYLASEEHETRNFICGIDPGIKTFLTVYSKIDTLKIGTGINFHKYYEKIWKINRDFDISNHKKTRKYQKTISKVYDRLHNMVKDMHFKASKYLCENYKQIRLGELSTNSTNVISNATSNLSNACKRMLQTLSFYSFTQRLKSQAEKYGCTVKIVSEYMTSQTCSSCGETYRVGRSRTYECRNRRCRLVADRDVNAAKNIRYMETVVEEE